MKSDRREPAGQAGQHCQRRSTDDRTWTKSRPMGSQGRGGPALPPGSTIDRMDSNPAAVETAPRRGFPGDTPGREEDGARSGERPLRSPHPSSSAGGIRTGDTPNGSQPIPQALEQLALPGHVRIGRQSVHSLVNDLVRRPVVPGVHPAELVPQDEGARPGHV